MGVLTLEDLARLKSGLKRHRRPNDRTHIRSGQRTHRNVRGTRGSSQSLCSIPEDLDGESDSENQSVSESAKSDTESLQSSSKSSVGSDDDASEEGASGASSRAGICCSPPRSLSEAEVQRMSVLGRHQRSPQHKPLNNPVKLTKKAPAPRCEGPPIVHLRTGKQNLELNLDNFANVGELRQHIQGATGIPSRRQTLILAGKRLPLDSDEDGQSVWNDIRNHVRPGQKLMLIGSIGKPSSNTAPAARNISDIAEAASPTLEDASPQLVESADNVGLGTETTEPPGEIGGVTNTAEDDGRHEDSAADEQEEVQPGEESQ